MQLALIIITAIAAVIAWRTYRNAKISTRRKTTFETLSSQNWDADYITARNIFTDQLISEIRILNAEGIKKLLDPDIKENLLKKRTNGNEGKANVYTTKDEVLKMIINHNELFAVGVRLGTLDEKMLYLNVRASYIDDWNALSEFIKFVRRSRNNDFIGIEFETLARKWKGKPPKTMSFLEKVLLRWPQP